MSGYSKILLIFSLSIILLFSNNNNLFSQQSSSDSTLTILPINGGVSKIISGLTYTVVFDAYIDATTISPANNDEASEGDLGINIFGEPLTNIDVAIEFPESLVGSKGSMMPITFPSSGPGSGVRVETGGFFNPNVSNMFNLGGGGVCKLRFGYVFTVPPNSLFSGDTYTGMIRCFVSPTGRSQTKTNAEDTVEISITIKTVDLSIKIAPKNATVINLARGKSYNIAHNAYTLKDTIIPNNNSETVLSNFGFDISGSPNANIVIELSLPKFLSGPPGNSIGITFPSSGPGSGVRAETGGFFNPNVTNTFNMGGGGTVNIRLGYILSIPQNVQPGTYTATMSSIATYTSLAKSGAMQQATSLTSQLTIKITSLSFEYITNAVSHLQISNVQKGSKYFVSDLPYTNGYSISPSLHGETVDSPLGIEVRGDVGTPISVVFSLPKYLTSSSDLRFKIDFSTGHFSDAEAKTIVSFDPKITNHFTIGNSGKAQFRFGCFFTVPSDIPSGIYTAYVQTNLSTGETVSSFQAQTIQIRVAVGQSFPQPGQPQPVLQLKQNYPNPFNPGTDISFTLLSPATIDLSIYNLLGQKVGTVFSGALASGDYIKHWDAGGLPGGIYFSRLESGSSVSIIKLILLK